MIRSAGAALVLLVCLSAAPASAQRDLRARTFGGGFSVGVGAARRVDYQRDLLADGNLLAFAVPRLELMGFVGDDFALDISVSLFTTIVGAAVGVFNWTTTIYAEWSFGEQYRFLVGPGVGFDAIAGDHIPGPGGVDVRDDGASVRIAGLLGFEALTEDRRVGLRLLARPWFAVGGGSLGSQLGGGALIELAVLCYRTE